MQGEERTAGGLIEYGLRSVKTGDDCDTEVAVQNFGDTLFVVITQLKKIGTLILIVPETPLAGETQNTTTTYDIKVLMGAPANLPEVHAFCRWFASRIHFKGKSILLSLAVRDFTSTTNLRPVVDTVATLLNEKRR